MVNMVKAPIHLFTFSLFILFSHQVRIIQENKKKIARIGMLIQFWKLFTLKK